jgi:hypothetical protein
MLARQSPRKILRLPKGGNRENRILADDCSLRQDIWPTNHRRKSAPKRAQLSEYLDIRDIVERRQDLIGARLSSLNGFGKM